jgi:uncharacterized membrane protein
MSLNSAKRVRTLLFTLLVAGASLAAASCSSDSDEDSVPTVDCATATVPTFANVTVFSTVCTGCHASTKTGAARNLAPVGLDFDTFASAQPHARKAVSEVYTGAMPPNGANADLTEAQKTELYNWGLCGTPQ